jgi:hypothetical protein
MSAAGTERVRIAAFKAQLMGMHLGLVCVKGTVAEFRAAFAQAWPKLEITATAENFADADAIWAWKKSQAKFVSGADWSKDNPGREVYLFWPSGDWAMMLDPSYVLASDDDGLKYLSTRFGIAMTFIVETAGGTAAFEYFENGELRRSIANCETDLSTEGEPLAEESGIDISNYYMKETEALWNAFGLSPYETMESAAGCHAICTIDRTDYSDALATMAKSAAAKRPWWKFW